MQTLRYCESGNMYVHADFSLGWFNKAKNTRNGQPIPLLDEKTKTICGVPVHDFHSPILEKDLQDKIRNELKKITYKVKYPVKKFATEEFKESKKQQLDFIFCWYAHVSNFCCCFFSFYLQPSRVYSY